MTAVIIVLIIIVLLLGGLIPTWYFAGKLYRSLLVRETPEKWGRVCSFPEDQEYSSMYEEGLAWGEKYADKKQEVSVESTGLRLVGEYYDFGYDKAAIIIPGRTESCKYSYYFAEPYRQGGCNILVIDNRAHGLSEGKYPTLGFSECLDLLAWGRLLHETYGNSKVFLHGICIGASSALFALTNPDCPGYMAGMVADGMYTTFYDSFKCHMRLDHHPIFPVAPEVMAYIRIYAKANVVSDGPIRRIGDLRKPILFLHSREDTFSLPEKAQLLYDKCVAEKELHFFDKGAHSRVRLKNREEYDRTIVAFLEQQTDRKGVNNGSKTV